jgi:uncharacterized protein (TIGR02246 family)
MDRILFGTLVLIVVMACAACHSSVAGTLPPPTFTTQDEIAVRTIVSEFASTWNRHDMKAMHELDTDDVQWVNDSGNLWRGKAAVYKGHDAIHRTIFAKTSMSVEQTDIRAITPDVAVAVATLHFGPLIDASGRSVKDLKTRGSFTMVKRDGAWKIVHFHNTDVDPEAEKSDPLTWEETGFIDSWNKVHR